MATLGDVANKARALTHTDTSNYTAANLLIDVNMWYQKVVSMILESMDSMYWDDGRVGQGGSIGANKTYPIATRVLVAAQRDYAFQTASWSLQSWEGAAAVASQTLLPLKVRRMDVSYDGTTFYRASPLDTGAYPYGLGSVTQEDANFIKQAPQYQATMNAIFLYPTATAADVSAGAKMRLEFERNVVAFTTADYSSDPNDSTQILGFDAVFHMFVAYGAALEKAKAENLPQLENLTKDVAEWEARLRIAYSNKNRDVQSALGYAYDYEFGR